MFATKVGIYQTELCLCFRWCPWNRSLVEHPQERHPLLWAIHGPAKMLLLRLQVIDLISCIVSFVLYSTHWIALWTSLSLVFCHLGRSYLKLHTCTSYWGWTCSSCSHRTACPSFTQNSRGWVHEIFRPTFTSGTQCPWSRCWNLTLDKSTNIRVYILHYIMWLPGVNEIPL